VACSAGAWGPANFDVSGITDGTNVIDVNASQTDSAGNTGNATLVEADKDTAAPAVATTSAPVANAANSATYPVSGTCTTGDGNVTVSIVGVAPSQSVACSTGAWGPANFDVSGITDGTNVIDVNASQTDSVGNTGNATLVEADKDTAAPTVDIQGEPITVNTTAAFTVTFEFSENVTGFVLGDITVGNGAASNFVATDGNTYTADITPGGTSPITIDGAAGAAQDAAANNNTAATQASIAFDAAAPSVDIQGEPVNVNSTAAFNVTFEFSEDVTGFAVGDITVGNGAASNFIAVDGNTYTADITPTGTSPITIDVAAGVAQDVALNGNIAATQASIVFDNTAPGVDIQGEPGSINTTPFNVTFEFSEAVTGFAVGDITVGNGSAGTFVAVDGNTYTANITPDGLGTITIDVAAGVAQDAAANNNTAATQASVVFDNTAPTVDIQGEPVNVNSTAVFNVTFEFSEAVTGFVLGDITVGNGSAGTFVAVDGNTYTANITPDGLGTITIDVAAGVALDIALNGNTAATQASVVFDNTAPSVDIQGEPVNVNSTAAFNVTFEFSEDVTGFAVGDITVGNGSAGTFVAVDGNTYTANITPDGLGDITIDVAAGVAQDAAANNNTAATQASVVFDNTAPTVDILGEPGSTNTTPFNVTFEFSEDVTGFVVGEITVGNGAASNFVAVDGNTYTADIAPDGNGAITIDVAAGVAQDVATNTNTAAVQAVVSFDNDADNDGIPDNIECPAGLPHTVPNCPDADGDGIPDVLETDSDNDGILDANEVGIDNINPIDSDGDGIPDYRDTDSDGDGIADAVEGAGDSDGDGIPDYVDVGATGDSDGDLIPDSVECPAYPACPDSDSDNTPDYLETDSDNDGINDIVEAGVDPTQPLNTDADITADLLPDYRDTDSDEDGALDSDVAEGVGDDDGDGIPNYVDAASAGPGAGDSDGDGLLDNIECELYPLCADSDADSTPDYMEADSDNDGILDVTEAGTSGVDTDVDGIPDLFDADSDGDGNTDVGVLDLNNDGIIDGLINTHPLDSDGDGTPDYQDTDSDNDGTDDATEGVGDIDADGIPDNLDTSNGDTSGTDVIGSGDSDGDGIGDGDECLTGLPCPDVDADGKPDYLDNNHNDGPLGNIDGDADPNYLDLNDDNDGILDSVEDLDIDGDANPFTNPNDTDGDGIPDYQDTDSDNDSIDDVVEGIVDTDGDGIPDYVDADDAGPGAGDSDNDGASDLIADYMDADSTPAVSAADTTISVNSASVTAGTTITITVQAKDANGNNYTVSGGAVTLASTGSGAVSAVTDNGNGTYTATISNPVAETVTISGTIAGNAITDTATVTYTAVAAAGGGGGGLSNNPAYMLLLLLILVTLRQKQR
jgi:type IV secretory pathway VirB9-like protein